MMTCKLALIILTTSLLLSISTFEFAHSQPPTQTEPTQTPAPQMRPPSPWELMLIVFASVTLTAIVLTFVQKLRARSSIK